MIMNRIRQFINALTAKISDKDIAFVKMYLTTEEEKLFWEMSVSEQFHSLHVAYTAIHLIAEFNNIIDKEIVIKAALLHDVGKKQGDMSTFDKVLAVLANKLLPSFARNWSKQGRGGKIDNIRHALYIYYYHPFIGAQKLKEIHTKQVIIDMIEKHHDAQTAADSSEIHLLRAADELN